MKKYIKFPDKVIMIDYNASTRKVKRSIYTEVWPMLVEVCVFYSEEPLDMFFQSDKDLLSEVNYYASSSVSRIVELKRPAFFGKRKEKLKRYYQLNCINNER